MNSRCIRVLALSSAFALAATQAFALTIVPDFSTLGTVYSDKAGNLSNDAGQGSTDVTAAFHKVATYVASSLEKAVGVTWTETISFQVQYLYQAVANSGISSNDGNGRPTDSNINIATGTAFFIDPTPADNSEFAMTSRSADLGGGSVNVSRIGNAVPGSDADGKWDLATVLLHEMEHSIAYNAGQGRYADRVVYDSGPSFIIPSRLTGLPTTFDIPLTPGSHLDGYARNWVFNDTVIADPGFGPGQRALLTSAEIYGACYIAGCTRQQVNIDPYQTAISAVPLPAAGSLMLGGLVTMLGLQVARPSRSRRTAGMRAAA